MLSEFLEVVRQGKYVVLDTETTGLDRPSQVIQIAVYDPVAGVGHVSLVKPKRPIPPVATSIHGFKDSDFVYAPLWTDIRDKFWNIIRGKTVIVYNAVYDRKLMHWTDEEYGLEHFDYKAENTVWHCAMEAYAEYHGEINPYYGFYKWQRLTAAMEQCGLPLLKAHGALQDAMMTHSIIKFMVENPK